MARSSPREGAVIDAEVRSFFRAIKDSPEDDTPRLIFADWLQERGDSALAARGEFLRLNVLRHRLSPDDPQYDALKRREAEIVSRYQWDWLGPLPDAARWSFERGMIQLRAPAANLLTTEITVWTSSEAGLWIDALALTGIDVANEHLIQLSTLPLLDHLNRLDLSDNDLRNIDYFLGHYGILPFLVDLVLSGNRLTFEDIACLARRDSFRRLSHLDLSSNRLRDSAANLLARSPYLKNLATLRLGHHRFSAAGVALLREAFGDRVQL